MVQRDSVSGATPIKEFAAARCDTVGMFGAGWIVLRRWATFAEAQADRAALNGTNMPAVWCLFRRDAGLTATEFSVARCTVTARHAAALASPRRKVDKRSDPISAQPRWHQQAPA